MNLIVNFRPISQDDEPFLFRLYANTREEEFKLLPWNEPQKVAFLQIQFAAQYKYYQEQFQKANFWIIEQQDKPIGRLYLDYRADEVRIIDITILSEYRNQGIGSQILQDILISAAERDLPVRISVGHNNPALNLYNLWDSKKLGIRKFIF